MGTPNVIISMISCLHASVIKSEAEWFQEGGSDIALWPDYIPWECLTTRDS